MQNEKPESVQTQITIICCACFLLSIASICHTIEFLRVINQLKTLEKAESPPQLRQLHPQQKLPKPPNAVLPAGHGAVCPHCQADKPWKVTAKPDSKCKVRAGLYKCRKCRKQLTFKVGSIFEDSKIPCSKWCMAIALLCSSKKAMSSHQVSRMLGVTQKTAWFMSHRIRHAFAPVLAAHKLTGSVEIDEAMFGVKNQPKLQVVALIERGGEVRTKIVDRISHRNIGSFMRDNIAKGSTVNTDANPRYKGVYLPAIKHEAVNHSQKEFIREKADGSKVHVNHCESFFSLLKRGVTGAFHHISKEHLHRYCDEFSFRWNTRKLTDGERFQKAISTSIF